MNIQLKKSFKKYFYFFFFLLILLFVQTNNSRANRSAYINSKLTASPKNNISLIGNRLPPNYKGDDIEIIFDYMKTIAFEKDEFETTDAYKKRIAQSGIEERLYAFQYRPMFPTLYPNYIKYDADSRSLRLPFQLERIEEKRNHYGIKYSIIVKVMEDEEQISIESNAFGVSTEVSTYSGTRYDIALSNWEKIGHKLGRPLPIVNYNIVVKNIVQEAAKTAKENAKILIICRPGRTSSAEPLLWEGRYDTSARIDHPIRNSYRVNYINVNVSELWVYNQETGEIYLKQILSNQ